MTYVKEKLCSEYLRIQLLSILSFLFFWIWYYTHNNAFLEDRFFDTWRIQRIYYESYFLSRKTFAYINRMYFMFCTTKKEIVLYHSKRKYINVRIFWRVFWRRLIWNFMEILQFLHVRCNKSCILLTVRERKHKHKLVAYHSLSSRGR